VVYHFNLNHKKIINYRLAAAVDAPFASPSPATSIGSVSSSLAIDCSMLSSATSFESLFLFCGSSLMLL
jgi:hypothetical protein